MTRASLRVPLACLATLCLVGPALAKPQVVEPAAQSFRVGNLNVFALRDADNVLDNDGKVFGVKVGAAAVAEVLKRAGAPTDKVTLGVDALLVKAPDRTMLFDTGLGPGVHGALMGSLAKTGVSPGDVTDVFITHSHGDHVGGLLTAAGALAFPNATIHLSAKEWTWMQAQSNSQAIANAIAAKVVPFEPDATVLPGVKAIALAGHTPGHVGYAITSGGAEIIDIGDTAHSAIVSLAEPDWAIGYDNDQGEGEVTRAAELKRLADSKALLFAPHFPFPGVGHIEAKDGAFAWQPGLP
jgi:glyoxylase-like metal-dependent hydrolase (beta-lactamase superfamily II)